jgi:effector-binding domain-containing protein
MPSQPTATHRHGLPALLIIALVLGAPMASAQQSQSPPATSTVPLPPVAPAQPAPAQPGTAAPQGSLVPPPATDPSIAEAVQMEPKAVITIRGESTWDDGFDNLMKTFQRLTREAAKAGYATRGRPQAAFLSTDDNGFKYEAMLEIAGEPATPPQLSADLRVSKSPAGKALRFTHTGAYDEIDSTYEAITAYLDDKGLVAKNVFVEEYLNDPKTSEDASLEMNIYVLVE